MRLIVFVAMILGIIVPVFTSGRTYCGHVPIRGDCFARRCSHLPFPSRDDSKAWLKVVILIFVYIAMWYIVGAIYTVGMNWLRIRW